MKTINYFKKCDNKENNESIYNQRINILILKGEKMKYKFAEKRREEKRRKEKRRKEKRSYYISQGGRRETISPVAKMAFLR